MKDKMWKPDGRFICHWMTVLETTSRNNGQASKRLAIKVQAPDKLLLMAAIRATACFHLTWDLCVLRDQGPVVASKRRAG